MLRSGLDALHRFASDKAMGYLGGYSGRQHFYEVHAGAKRHLATLLGCNPEEVALTASATDGINAVATGLQWRPGDNVVVPAHEFPSVLMPWVRAREAGVEVREVDVRPGEAPLAALAAACDARTRVVAASHVSYLTGERLDLEGLRAVALRHGALLLLDASHSLGVLPVQAELADFVVSCCYKFLLATHGVGICYWNRRRLPDWQPASVGWHSVDTFPPTESRIDWKSDAGRFEHGNPAFPSVYVLETAAAYLGRAGSARLMQHVLDLGLLLHKGISALGLAVMTPAESERRGPNICFHHAEADALTAALRLEGIYVWGGHDRVRISLHGYNDESDVAAVLLALKRLLRH